MADLLWLSAETPARDGGGGQRRQFHQISALIKSGIEVEVATLAGPQDDSTIRGVARVHRFEARRFNRRSRELERLIDAISPARALVAHVDSAPHVLRELQCAHVPFLVDFHNVVSRWHGVRGDARLAAEWRSRERSALALAARATACSVEERAALVALGTETPIDVSPHGVDPDEWPVVALAPYRDPTLAMFGAWNHEPNRIAAEWLSEKVWPTVRTVVPNSRLLLLGPGDPPASLVVLDGVEFRGRVDSLAETLGSVRIAVVPIQHGIGTRVKFVESLASGAAVVSTTAGCEGFDADGAFLRVDEPAQFAAACIELLQLQGLAAELGQRGRELALSNFTWRRVTEPIQRFAQDELGA